MKKLLLIAMTAAMGTGAYAQGDIVFGTLGATVMPNVIRTMDGSNAGVGFMAALYYESAPDIWEAVGNPTGFIVAGGNGTGLILGVNRQAATDPAGAPGNFQIRAWESALGAATYEQAVASGVQHGSSAVIFSPTRNPANVSTPIPTLVSAANASGAPLGFQMVPEPSVIALGLLGAGALLAFRRRK